MRIAILSCFYPFRGGIAQFNANLMNELKAEHEVRAFNFTRQYPAFLFPGKTQYVRPEDEAIQIESSAVLDTANPLNWFSAANAICSWEPDVVIMRYWMSYFAPSLGTVAHRIKAKRAQTKIIAILDNVIPHERHFFDTPLTQYFLNQVDACITLCEEVAQDLRELKPDAKYKVLHHPVYSHFGTRITREEACAKIEVDSQKRNILFFGLIREYKGLDILLRAFASLSDEYQLIIAGEPYGSFEKYQALIDSSPNSERIKLFPDYIRDSEVKNYFCAADVCVLPYRTATQSGISAISCHFAVPMIVTDVGGLKETIAARGTGLVCPECSPECVREYIEKFFDDKDLRSSFSESIAAENQRLSWSSFCQRLTDFAITEVSIAK